MRREKGEIVIGKAHGVLDARHLGACVPPSVGLELVGFPVTIGVPLYPFLYCCGNKNNTGKGQYREKRAFLAHSCGCGLSLLGAPDRNLGQSCHPTVSREKGVCPGAGAAFIRLSGSSYSPAPLRLFPV